MEKFRVCRLDVWGNAVDGYTVNDMCEIGNIELSEEAEKPEILQALFKQSLIINPESVDLEMVEIIDAYPDYYLDYEGKPYFLISIEERK